MQIRKDVTSGVPGSHFATMRESMPEIKTEDVEKPTERNWAHCLNLYQAPPEVNPVSEPFSYVGQ